MKTVVTLCLAGVLSLMFHHHVSAQNIATPFTAPASSYSTTGTLVKILSFTGNINSEKVLLNWTVGENQDANQFEVEKSTNGTDFFMAALVFGTDKKDTDNYMFYEKTKNTKTYYRVKIILKNGMIGYSPVIIPGADD